MLRLISWKTICCSRRVASILPHVHSPLYPVYVDGPVQADTTRGTEVLVIAIDMIIRRDKQACNGMGWHAVGVSAVLHFFISVFEIDSSQQNVKV